MDGIEELIVLPLEAGAELVNSPKGCLIYIIILIIIGSLVYYFYDPIDYSVKGVVTEMLPNDRVSVKYSTGNKVFSIEHSLYINKKVCDSIIIK